MVVVVVMLVAVVYRNKKILYGDIKNRFKGSLQKLHNNCRYKCLTSFVDNRDAVAWGPSQFPNRIASTVKYGDAKPAADGRGR